MKIKDVKKFETRERFLYWIEERESVRLRKESGHPKPWTDDEILQTYKFCNVRRMDDRVSQWLLKNWYEPNFDHPNMLTACTLARQLNNTESLEAVGFPFRWNPSKVKKILEKRVSEGLKNFSAAYMITGTLGGTKIVQIVDKVVTPIHESKPMLNTDSMELSCQCLLPFAGFSTFISGQVIADMRWASEGTWEDKDDWAPVGPGSRRGINRFFERPKETSLRQSEFNKQFQEVCSFVRDNFEGQHLEAIDIQNCLCEFDKYERTLFENRRPKCKYNGKDAL